MAVAHTRFGVWPIDAEGRPRPRIIRKVFKRDKKGKPKIARDRKAMIQMERVVARVDRQCDRHRCPVQNHDPGDKGMIMAGDAYAVVTYPNRGRRMGSVYVPDRLNVHPQCVPEKARPLVRFLFD